MSLVRCKNGHLYSARKYGDTCPYCNTQLEKKMTPKFNQLLSDPDKTIPLMGVDEKVDPVVGWLVCIEGVNYGKDYRIHNGKNFIGRADGMQIQILGDNAISRVNHAAAVYDGKNRTTFILPGDATGLVYHNGEAVYSPTELAPYSIVELGHSKFLFIPLCGEHFEWENQNE